MSSIGKTVQEIAEQLREEAKSKKTPFEQQQEGYQKLNDKHSRTLIQLGGEIIRSKAKDEEIKRCKAMIEKMKCCASCGNTEFDGGMGSCCKFDDLRCEGFSHWELKK